MNDPIAVLLNEQPFQLTAASVALRVLLSVVLSALIGWERSSKRHSAGLRTFMIVSVATTAAMLLDISLGQAAGGGYLLSAASVVAIAIISVNSMLFSSRNQIKGLTTAVGLWAATLVGLGAGAGYYTVTLVTFLALLCILSLFPIPEMFLKNRSNHFEVHLELKNRQYLQDFVTTIRKLGLTIDDIEINPAYVNSGLSVYTVAISISSKELKKYKTHREIIQALETLDYIYHIEEMGR